MHAFLLYKDSPFNFKKKVSDQTSQVMKDLEMDHIFDAMSSNLFIREKVVKVCSERCFNVEQILYRQAVLQDCIAQEELTGQIYKLLGETLELNQEPNFEISRKKAKYMMELSMEVWGELIPKLKKLTGLMKRMESVCQSEGWKNLAHTQCSVYGEADLEQMGKYLKSLKNTEDIWVITGPGPHLKSEEYTLTRGVAGSKGIGRLLSKVIKDGNSFQVDTSNEDEFIALSKLRDASLKTLSDQIVTAKEECIRFLQEWERELAFYIGCLNLRRKLTEIGVAISLPVPYESTASQLDLQQLYNVSLALQKGKGTVPNTIDCLNRQMIVVTGSNQGGKTTWLRALGQAIIMMQAGIFVAANHMQGNLGQVYTHFIREEDESLKSGKLDEELLRMSQIVSTIHPGDLLLMNESFSSTNEQEGSGIGMEITSALLHRGIRIAYVTHFFRLVQMLVKQESENILFLNAARREDGSRTYELKEGQPQVVGHGQDLYEEIFR